MPSRRATTSPAPRCCDGFRSRDEREDKQAWFQPRICRVHVLTAAAQLSVSSIGLRAVQQVAHVTKLAASISRYRVADVPAAPPPDSLLPLSPVPLRLMRTEETQAPDPGL